jgi:hypothetical protein
MKNKKCDLCDGFGLHVEYCTHCNGAGYLGTSYEDIRVCNKCAGSGLKNKSVECEGCNGKGYKDWIDQIRRP